MKRICLILMMMVGCISMAFSQEKWVSGTVVDETGEALTGVSVTLKNEPGLGQITNVDGEFKIQASEGSTLIFTYIGFDKKEVPVKNYNPLKVVMVESKSTVLDEVTVTGLGNRKKITVTGAVTTVNPDDLKTPSASIANALAGNVPGILARQISGQPGRNVSEFWIRGISTFGGGSSALVLVDGFERDINEVAIEDIASFTVLKDASATAIYGSRGANGVILITTKHGNEGKLRVNAKVEYSYNTPTKIPETVNGETYARMENEAYVTRNMEAPFSDSDLYLIKTGLDPDLYPNVDWIDLMMKKGAPTMKADLNLSGGGSTVRYYLSGSFVDEGGMYKVDNALKNQYNTNSNYHRATFRMNVDVNLTKTTLLSMGVAGALDKMNEPGANAGDIWNALFGYTPIMSPVKYTNGYIGGSRTAEKDNFNPWVRITQMGYDETWKSKIQFTLNLEQNLDMITKGLKFYGRIGYDTNSDNANRHHKQPEIWNAERQRANDGSLIFTKLQNEKLMEVTSGSNGDRYENLEAELHYDRTFNSAHTIGAILKYQVDRRTSTQNVDYISAIEHKHQGLIGRFTYGWKTRYYFDFNFGYTGSENFAKHHQYGFFPAYSVAWNVAEEPWVSKHMTFVEMFKLRFSYGKVGNDNLRINGNEVRFPYHSSFQTGYFHPDDETKTDYGIYQYADVGFNRGYSQLTYSAVASTNVSWEIARKRDLGLDFSMWHDNFSGTIDLFNEERTGIYQVRNFLPDIVGLSDLTTAPAANVGSVKTKGIDGNVAVKQNFGKAQVTLRGNFTYSKSEIKDYDEENNRYWYRMQKGYPVDQLRGLIAQGLFSSYDEIRESPKQNFGTYAPGDIKYKDVNGDGIINDDDIVPIGTTTRPNFIYGFGMSVLYKGFDFNVHFQGAGKSSFCLDWALIRPFNFKTWGNISTDLPGNYWSLGTNEDPNARYPRLDWKENTNNYRNSTFWERDGSYLRLKTLEVGYTLPTTLMSKFYITKMRVYFIGTNLLTFSKFKLWDPELGSSSGRQYPLTRAFTLGLTVSL